jgi:hypothetical protein
MRKLDEEGNSITSIISRSFLEVFPHYTSLNRCKASFCLQIDSSENVRLRFLNQNETVL